MEYEKRSIRWYWLTLFMMFSCVVIYSLLMSNKYLYSNHELRVAMAGNKVDSVLPVPSPKHQVELPGALNAATFFARFDLARTGNDPSGHTYGKDLIETQNKQASSFDDIKPTLFSGDSTGFYVVGKIPWLLAISPDTGEVRWRFRFASNSDKDQPTAFQPSIDQVLVYAAQSDGSIVSLRKDTGQLQWLLTLHDEIVAAPLILKNSLYVLIKQKQVTGLTTSERDSKKKKVATSPYVFAIIKRETGELSGFSRPLDIKPPVEVSLSSDQSILYLTSENKVVALSTENFEVDWSQSVTDPIKGPVVLNADQLYVLTLAGKLVQMDVRRRGRIEKEIDVGGVPNASPTILPLQQRMAITTEDGYLHMVDLKAGERIWRFNLENRNSLKETWAARLEGHLLEALNMKWHHRGWTLWAPCVEKRICVYNPDKGQIILRINLSSLPLAPPVYAGKKIYFLTANKSGAIGISTVESKK